MEVSRRQQSQMKAILEKLPPGSPILEKINAAIQKVEFACNELEENSFGYLKNGALDNVGASTLKEPMLNALTAYTEKNESSIGREAAAFIEKQEQHRTKMEAAAQNSENQKTFLVDLINSKWESCSIEEQQKIQTELNVKGTLAKMLAEDEESKVGFKLTLIRCDNQPIRVNFKPFKEEFRASL